MLYAWWDTHATVVLLYGPWVTVLLFHALVDEQFFLPLVHASVVKCHVCCIALCLITLVVGYFSPSPLKFFLCAVSCYHAPLSFSKPLPVIKVANAYQFIQVLLHYLCFYLLFYYFWVQQKNVSISKNRNPYFTCFKCICSYCMYVAENMPKQPVSAWEKYQNLQHVLINKIADFFMLLG